MLGGIVKYIVDHPRFTLKDVAQYLKEQAWGLSEDDRARSGGICISDLLVREKEKRAVHVNYAGGWLLFIADMVKKTEQAFVAGSVEAILTLFFLSVTGLRHVDPKTL